jgi:hypothetical protein
MGIVVMTVTAEQPKSAGTISHVAAARRIFWLLPSPHARHKCIRPACPSISWYQTVDLQLHLLPLLETLTQMVTDQSNTQPQYLQ